MLLYGKWAKSGSANGLNVRLKLLLGVKQLLYQPHGNGTDQIVLPAEIKRNIIISFFHQFRVDVWWPLSTVLNCRLMLFKELWLVFCLVRLLYVDLVWRVLLWGFRGWGLFGGRVDARLLGFPSRIFLTVLYVILQHAEDTLLLFGRWIWGILNLIFALDHVIMNKHIRRYNGQSAFYFILNEKSCFMSLSED